MTKDQETFVKMVIEALIERWQSLGVFGWVILVALITLICLGLFLVVRWIFHGGLARYRSLGNYGHHRDQNHLPPNEP